MTSSSAILPEVAERPPSAPAWDTELFVLGAQSRTELRECALELATFVEQNPDVRLTDLAWSLASELPPGGSRLAVIAGSTDDLRARLKRAAERLADPNCRQVRDIQGIYFFEQPLFPAGKLALLMPGEGAQYLGMLGELAVQFPEVAAGFVWCDRVAEEAGRPEASLRSVIFPPADATPAQRAAAEARLRELGPSIFGVLVADLAANLLLKNLQLPVSAYAGHSAGELAALYAAGAIPDGANSSAQLVAIMDLMQRQEEEAVGPETLLLATGAGKTTIAEIVAARGARDVFVAMDNCPHQSVVVGAAEGVRSVEAALQERGIVCERLALRRPYHTSLFAPWMGPFYETFDRMPIHAPRTPLYSATTGQLFPSQPNAIRKLTVDHWKSPVEFTHLIETMYADGIRIFVECGPRGNLSAFVEDILRGRPFAALPLDVPRRRGVTQLNHVIGQLLAHHVPLNAGHLFAGREPQFVEWRARGQRPFAPSPSPARDGSINGSEASIASEEPGLFDSATQFDSTPAEGFDSTSSPSSDRAQLMLHYLSVMDQFLDTQRTVMETWLQRGTQNMENGTGDSEFVASVLNAIPPLFDEPAVAPSPDVPTPTLGATPGTLIGEIIRFVPGREIVVRRTLDIAEDRYAADHTIGGRTASRVDPDQHGLPILPMTFSLELMAECAVLLLPGQVVTALRDIRLMRWLPFEAEPITIEVTATVQSTDPPTVKAVIRDVGVNKPTAQGVVELSADYPEPPMLGEFVLSDGRPCKATLDDVYRNLFHGPLFRGMRSLDRYGAEGIEGTVEVLPRAGWFRSTPEPQLVTDPVLVDACMHILAAWHLEQPDWAGRILLPIGLKRIEFFSSPPPAGTMLRVCGLNEEESARHFVHGVEVALPNGRLWCRLHGAAYWRFYLPFGHVNFFGPKDEYFLSRPLPEAVPARNAERGTKNEEQEIADSSFRAARCWFLEIPADLVNAPVLRAAGAQVTMTARELREFYGIHKKLSDTEVNKWLFSRIVGKDAVRSLRSERFGDRMYPADIELHWDGRSRPTAAPRDLTYPGEMPAVCIAHCDGKVAALAAYRAHVGIALDKVGDAEEAARRQAAAAAILGALDCQAAGATSNWEANAILPGAGAPDSGEVIDLAISLPPELAERHPDLASHPLLVRTLRLDDVIVATTFCEPAPV
jgi:malonyl CoA-acyl carrier protein transacylase